MNEDNVPVTYQQSKLVTRKEVEYLRFTAKLCIFASILSLSSVGYGLYFFYHYMAPFIPYCHASVNHQRLDPGIPTDYTFCTLPASREVSWNYLPLGSANIAYPKDIDIEATLDWIETWLEENMAASEPKAFQSDLDTAPKHINYCQYSYPK